MLFWVCSGCGWLEGRTICQQTSALDVVQNIILVLVAFLKECSVNPYTNEILVCKGSASSCKISDILQMITQERQRGIAWSKYSMHRRSCRRERIWFKGWERFLRILIFIFSSVSFWPWLSWEVIPIFFRVRELECQGCHERLPGHIIRTESRQHWQSAIHWPANMQGLDRPWPWGCALVRSSAYQVLDLKWGRVGGKLVARSQEDGKQESLEQYEGLLGYRKYVSTTYPQVSTSWAEMLIRKLY